MNYCFKLHLQYSNKACARTRYVHTWKSEYLHLHQILCVCSQLWQQWSFSRFDTLNMPKMWKPQAIDNLQLPSHQCFLYFRLFCTRKIYVYPQHFHRWAGKVPTEEKKVLLLWITLQPRKCAWYCLLKKFRCFWYFPWLMSVKMFLILLKLGSQDILM